MATRKKTNNAITDPSVIRKGLDARKTSALVPFEVPEWGGTVYLRRLTIRTIKENRDRELDAIPLILLSVCKPDGTLLFSAEDEEWLQDEEIHVIQPLVNKICEINAINAGAFKTAEKN